MKIVKKLIILFSIILVGTIATTSIISFQTTEKSIIDSEIKEMESILTQKENLIQNLHDKASEDLVFALKNPLFVEYFDLQETKKGNIYQDGIMQFTERQLALKTKLDQWIYDFQNKFQVDETCLIDTTGQEHTRLVLKGIAPTSELSSTEKLSPFFIPTFEKNANEVNVQYPYVSPDTKRWVFAYSSPVVLGNGEKPAFYHFEMPITIFQNLVRSDLGRMYVIDPEGFLVADSAYQFHEKPNSVIPKEDFPPVSSISTSPQFQKLFQEMFASKNGVGTYSKDGQTYYVVYEKLPVFGWRIAYEKPYSLMLAGSTDLNKLGVTIGLMTIVISTGGLIGVFLISSRISNPITKLAKQCNQQNPSQLQKVQISTKDEISDVSASINGMIDKINDLEKQKDEFHSMVTHELKTPLTPIIGWGQTLKKPKILGPLNEKQISAIDNILENAKLLERLIGDVLDIQKIELKMMRFDSLDVNVVELMDFIHKSFENAMEPKKIQFVNFTEGKLYVKSDRNRIEQVFNNLIINAIDFVPQEKGRIEIGAKQYNDSVLFYVKDNGIGIPKDQQKNLFKKFHQIDSSLRRKHGGTGLGLSISKGIVESLGGKIWLESDKGIGATFYFTVTIDSNNKLLEMKK